MVTVTAPRNLIVGGPNRRGLDRRASSRPVLEMTSRKSSQLEYSEVLTVATRV